MNHRGAQWDQVWQSMKQHPFCRGCAVVMTGLVVSFFLGIAFIILFQALLFGVGWIGVYWPPVYRRVQRFLYPTASQSETEGSPFRGWFLLTLPVKLASVGYLLYWGFDILLRGGFLKQNLIWILFLQ